MSDTPQAAEWRTLRVKEHAAALGFDACGVAAAEPIDPGNRLGAWLDRGFHAEMEWMAETREVRRDIRLRLPGARSVVVVARNYYAERPPVPSGAGLVSRYAWGRDYHRALRKPVQALGAAIAGLAGGTPCYACVDTGPVLERAWAARAGIGWIGKNGLLIRPDHGSWCFLGVIATTADLAPDAPVENRCGACTQCLEACPTGALVAPFVLDARRCLAYHTIENRHEIPSTLHRPMGARIFGCDACQEACPWNRLAQETSEPAFLPLEGQANPNLVAWATMEETDFKRRFAGTPIYRATYRGLKRNIEIAQRNLSEPARELPSTNECSL